MPFDSQALCVRVRGASLCSVGMGVQYETREILNLSLACHARSLRSQPSGRCRDRTRDPTRVKGALYR